MSIRKQPTTITAIVTLHRVLILVRITHLMLMLLLFREHEVSLQRLTARRTRSQRLLPLSTHQSSLAVSLLLIRYLRGLVMQISRIHTQLLLQLQADVAADQRRLLDRVGVELGVVVVLRLRLRGCFFIDGEGLGGVGVITKHLLSKDLLVSVLSVGAGRRTQVLLLSRILDL